MAKGKLVDKGTHTELIKRSKEYQKLWNASMESSKWQVTNRKEEDINVTAI